MADPKKPLAAQMTTRIEILAPPVADSADAQTDTGRPTGRWRSIGVAWANVEPVSGEEFDRRGQAVARTRFRVTMRYRTGVMPSQRLKVLSGSRTNVLLEIVSAEPNDRSNVLVVECFSVTAQEGA